MEQFRPLLVDQIVMALLRTRKLRPEHGVVEHEVGGVWLGADGEIPRRCIRGLCSAIRHRRPPRILGVVAQTHRPLRADAGARHRRTRLPVERGRLAMIYIIAYDIADNKRRLRVAKAQESWAAASKNPCSNSASTPPRWRACVLGSPPSSQMPKTSSISTPPAHPAPIAPTYSAQP